MKVNKRRWSLYSLQAFGISVIGPGLFYLTQPIFDYFAGNRAAIEYTDAYINDWDSITVTLPDDLFENLEMGESHRTTTIKYNKHTKRRICASNEIFYIPQHKRYFEFICIEGVDFFIGHNGRYYDAAGVQSDLMTAGIVLSVYVNRKQWADKSYGTKEKPMPVFLHRIISGDNIKRRNAIAWKRDSIFPNRRFEYHYLPPNVVKRMRLTPDSVNRKFAGYYLRYLLSEEDFDRLFKEE